MKNFMEYRRRSALLAEDVGLPELIYGTEKENIGNRGQNDDFSRGDKRNRGSSENFSRGSRKQKGRLNVLKVSDIKGDQTQSINQSPIKLSAICMSPVELPYVPILLDETFTKALWDTGAERPQANRTELVNRNLVQMIANYVNEQHDTWDQFLREFAYAIRTAVNETTGKTPAELFLGRKLITPFQKLVMVSDGTEFAVGDIERLFEEARRNTKTTHEKWEKYHNRRRRDVQIKVNDWVLVATHPLSSATTKVVAKFKSKFESPYRVLDVKNKNAVIWKAGKRLTINVDQVRIYRHRKCDETEIGTGSSDNGNLRDESSGFDRVQRRSNESRDGKKKESGVGRTRKESSEVSEHRVPKRNLSSNDTNSVLPKNRKKSRSEETVAPTTSGYNLRPRIGKRKESLPTIERKTPQGGPVRSRKGRERIYSPYIEERTRSSNKNPRRGGDQQWQDQERRRTCTKK
ncbi:uncharacterized protein TNCV_382351 [Trichonephila clavipes]|nr:uncharacterized protein TNCV_382351 [Trichonephila clavipes]